MSKAKENPLTEKPKGKSSGSSKSKSGDPPPIPASPSAPAADVSRAKDLWMNNSYKNMSSLVERLLHEGLITQPIPPGNQVMEWHCVNKWMKNALAAEGEMIVEFEGEYFWGRTTTGQAVWLDYIIQEIYDDWKEGTTSAMPAQPGAGEDGSMAGSPESTDVMKKAHKKAKKQGINPKQDPEEWSELLKELYDEKGY